MKKVPRATYRLQFHAGFTFAHAADIADYLSAIGISHIYASPYLQAAPGSTHGYDVTDPARTNRELGGDAEYKRMCRAFAENGLAQVLDIVPNHMAVSHPEANAWWWDVLKNGRKSQYACFFDIDWDPPEKRLAGSVLLPVLENHFGRVIQDGKIRVELLTGSLVCRYGDSLFPISPESLAGFEGVAKGDFGNHNIFALAEKLNADTGALAKLLDNQHYRLAFWRAGAQDLNYRRFFAINELAGIRIEDQTVFNATHQLILDLLRKGVLDGVRIDHPDGLRDPEQYFRRLKSEVQDAWVVIEKILHQGEELPSDWPVDGTTGYDFLNLVTGLFIDPDGETSLTQFYTEFIGETINYANLVRHCKHQVMEELLAADLNRLSELMIWICEKHARYRDYTRMELKAALKYILAEMPVYRTYIRAATKPRLAERRVIEQAVYSAKTQHPESDPNLFDFVRDLLVGEYTGALESDFMLRFQQLSGPVMAKGVEDTAFYRYHRLSCLNEVGGDPSQFGTTVAGFHGAMQNRAGQNPKAMLSTSTHDTKRSEDVRARLALLSEIPEQWAAAVRRWSKANTLHKINELPDANTEYLLYQTVVGAWPIDAERVGAFMEKAAREAKYHTSWEKPEPAYEDALQNFTRGIMADRSFIRDLEAFAGPLISAGRINSLSQTLIKLTVPGVPDLYQGSELWDLSLVDPDNRRPVDFDLRRRLFLELEKMSPDQVLVEMDRGLPKLYVIWRTLQLRKTRPECFAPEAGYDPLRLEGKQKHHAMGYMRGKKVAVVVPVRIMKFPGDWQDTRFNLPGQGWRNVFTGKTVKSGAVFIGEVLRRFPVSLLVEESIK